MKTMMKHLVSVIKVAFFTALLVPQFVRGQVNYIETDEAQDLVLNSCSDNQITIFLFRYPDIGSKKTELDRHILEFEGM